MGTPVKQATKPVSSVKSGVKGPEYKASFGKDVPEKGVKEIEKVHTPKKAPGSVRV